MYVRNRQYRARAVLSGKYAPEQFYLNQQVSKDTALNVSFAIRDGLAYYRRGRRGSSAHI
jgi:hypothetical protein